MTFHMMIFSKLIQQNNFWQDSQFNSVSDPRRRQYPLRARNLTEILWALAAIRRRSSTILTFDGVTHATHTAINSFSLLQDHFSRL